MDTMFEIFNQPIIITLVSLAVGGYLLNLISDRRARQDKIREKAIELINELSIDFNTTTGLLFRHIRGRRVEVREDLKDASHILMDKRLSVRVRSKTYLKTDVFWQKYDLLALEILQVVGFIHGLSLNDVEQSIAQLKNHKKRFAEAWPLADEELIKHNNKHDPPFDEISSWVHMIRDRAISLFSFHLEKVLK